MGRLVYVREVSDHAVTTVILPSSLFSDPFLWQDREAEPRFTAPPGGGDRGMAPRGGYGAGAPGAGPRQIYVANVCSPLSLIDVSLII